MGRPLGTWAVGGDVERIEFVVKDEIVASLRANDRRR